MWQNKLHVYIHLVWGTRDRQPYITETVERKLFRYIESVCQRNDCSLLSIGGMPDHIHVLVKISTTVSLSDLMKQIKGGSSRFLTQELGQELVWQKGYGAFSVSPRHKDAVIAYILNQKKHHVDDTLWTEAENWIEEVSTNVDTQPKAPQERL